MPLEREGYVQNPNTSIQRPVITGQSLLPNQSTLSMDDKLSIILTKIDRLEQNDQHIISMAARLNNSEQKLHKFENKLNSNTAYLKQLAYHSIDVEARSRRNNLIFYGLADCGNEDTYEILYEFFEFHLNIDLHEMCVQRVHRLGSINRARATSQTPRRPIIAAFRDYRDTEYIPRASLYAPWYSFWD